MTGGPANSLRDIRIKARRVRQLLEDSADDALSLAQELADSVRSGEGALDVARAFFTAAVGLTKNDRWNEALQLLDWAIELDSSDPRVPYRRAVVLEELGRNAEAVETLAALLLRYPTYVPAALFIGLHARVDRIEEIGRCVAPLAIARANREPGALGNAIIVLVRLMRFDEATTLLDEVETLGDPKVAEGAFEIGVNIGDIGLAQRALRERSWTPASRFEKEVWRLRLALLKGNRNALEAPWERLKANDKLDIVNPPVRHAGAMTLGRYADGFDSNWVWHRRRRIGGLIRNLYQRDEPLADLAGANVLIIGYTELGDEIRLIELVDRVRSHFGACTIVVDRRIASLVARGRPDLTVIGKEKVRPEADSGVPVMLRRHLGAVEWERIGSFDRVFLIRDFESLLVQKVDDLPCLPRSLEPCAQLRMMWREILDDFERAPLIGLFWRSGRQNYRRSGKTTDLADWTPVFKKCRGNYVNLQFGDGVSREIAALDANADIFEMPGLNVKDDIDSVAALMCELDLVLTIPGTTQHLAGAIGARTLAVTHPAEALFRARPGTNTGTWSPNVEVVSGPPGRGFDGAIVNAARRLKEILRDGGPPAISRG